ncbi:MAG: trans-2-enoyl-CoA reductase family protein [Firmicutes bacterium]|uniref:Trans-2-enoyl-CoA reductase [NADH] n=1 Tax=Candidatus Scybalomonas excrementavium TaxID=2840943 RepID=A0A9D9I0J7_9FIRM|nr:trans-2-enoyl-CoA reductase family protein [Candidatus Scybalomonas excrementavium]
MIIEPKIRDFICTTAHPTGCVQNVKNQIEYTKKQGKKEGPKNVLIIGCSTGYGLASRIAATYTFEAATLGVMFEKPSNGRRTATAGYYNTKAFEQEANKDGFYAKTINGDAFSKEVKEEVIETIKRDLGTIDMIIYSLAAPRRKMDDGTTYASALKTVGETFSNKSLNLRTNEVIMASIEPATEEEISSTVKVMGGEDWKNWIEALYHANVMSEHVTTIAYSYIGPELTYPVYYEGTIGNAKKHLYETSNLLNTMWKEKGLTAYVSVNKALVTQSSAAIPIVPLYIALLYRVMKDRNLHEGCIEQINRLFHEKLNGEAIVDSEGKIRLDDFELRQDVQDEIKKRWELVTTENVKELSDIDGYWKDFYQIFGFGFDEVDYSQDVDLEM